MSIGYFPTVLPPDFRVPNVQRTDLSALRMREWNSDEYRRMIAAGIFGASEAVDLQKGWIVLKGSRASDEMAVRRWSVDEYKRLIDIGVLQESEPVQLLEGWIVQKMARNTAHNTALQKTQKRVREVLPSGWDLRSQMAIELGDSVPEPDCAIVEGDEDSYLAQHPTVENLAFVIEVADTSLTLDRTWMARIYARARIPIYWIVNIPNRQLELYSDPTGPTDVPEAAGYRGSRVLLESESAPVEIRGQIVAQLTVASLLPRP